MAEITVRLYANLRETAGAESLTVDADTVLSALDRLSTKCPALAGEIARARSSPDRIVVLLNGRTLRQESWPTALRNGDEVALFPPVSGG